jgi:phosphoglycerol transferase
VGAAAVSVAAAIILLRLWNADLRVPLAYGDDSLLVSLPVKSIVDHGWYLTNPSVGAPNGLELYDYPYVAADSFHLLTIKALSLFSHDWALLFNVYFLLGFPLITLSALAVFRHFGVGAGPALAGSVLYSFLPSRMLIGEGHIYLNVFYQVPLAVMLVLWVCGDCPPGLENGRGRSIAAIAISLLVATTGLYYAFFTGCFLLAGGLWAAVERRSRRNFLAGAALAGLILAAVTAQHLPTVVHRWRHGMNPEVGVRYTGEAEIYGMKVAQLLLPMERHRVSALRRLKSRYEASAPLGAESSAASLGAVGAVGFLVLLGVLFLSRTRPGGWLDERLRPLSVLSLIALLVATVGGLGSLFALLVTPQIRTYTRMHVFIGFFALFAVVILLDRLARGRPRFALCVLSAVLVVGLLDQTAPVATRLYQDLSRIYHAEEGLVRRIEASLPKDAIVFQLPYVSFPEAPGPTYDAIRDYLHSRSLRWTLPTMRGRPGDRWVRDVARLEPTAMVKALREADVSGILVDRRGYPDHGVEIERALGGLLGTKPLVSDPAQMAFYALPAAPEPVAPRDAAAEKRQLLALHPIVFRWHGGFYPLEERSHTKVHWCNREGELHLENDTALTRTVSIQMRLAAARPPAHLYIDGFLSGTVNLDGEATRFARTIDVPPGYHIIRFRSDGGRLDAPGDPRALVWRAEDPMLEEVIP